MKKFFNIIIVASTLIFLPGCSTFDPVITPEVKTYRLNETAPVLISSSQTHKSITVMPVIAVSGFDSSAMIYQSSPSLLSSFVESAWFAPPANMIQPVLTSHLQQSKGFSIVVSGPSLSSTDYLLNTTLLSLYQDFTVQPSIIHFSIDINLINNHSNQIIADQVFTAQVKVSENTPYGGVVAANQALTVLLNQAVPFLIMHIQHDNS